MKKATLALILLSTLSFTAIQSQNGIATDNSYAGNDEKDSLEITYKDDSIATDSLAVNSETVSETEEETVAANKALVSWYGGKFHGRLTANGERYNMNELTAAHKTLPFGTRVKIRNPKNGKEVIVRITDRGPYVKKREFDLSKAAFQEITSLNSGILNIQYEIL